MVATVDPRPDSILMRAAEQQLREQRRNAGDEGAMRAVLKQCGRAGRIPLPGDDGCSGRMIDADLVARDLRGGRW